ncbi:uncharacterized protein TNCV_36441 [Trichonephila clavipes]|nr:uncharacterized protein TNCV_36441 [Trichonephila clavipes]
MECDNWKRIIFSMNPDSVSLLMTSSYANGGDQDTGAIRQFCQEAYGNYTRSHLSARQKSSSHCVTSPTTYSRILSTPVASRSSDLLPTEHCRDVLGRRATAAEFQNTGELTTKLQKDYNLIFRKMSSGRGSQVVKVLDHGWSVTSPSPLPLKTRRVGQRCTLNLSRAQTSSRWCGVVGEGVPAHVSSSSLDHGSKLRGPSPKALV